MWDKGFRTIVFAVIYDAIYWSDEFRADFVDIKSLCETYNIELNEEQQKKVEDLMAQFLDKKQDYFEAISKLTNSWEKTYDIIKAVMCTSIMEYEEIKDLTTVEQKKKVVNKYVQIAQDMAGGNNPNLVYAIVGRLYGI